MVGVSRKSTFAPLGLLNQRGGNHVISTSCNTHSSAVPAARRVPELAGRTGRPRLLVREVRASLEPAAGPSAHRPKHQVAWDAGDRPGLDPGLDHPQLPARFLGHALWGPHGLVDDVDSGV